MEASRNQGWRLTERGNRGFRGWEG
jgi:hypothetical protein